MLKHVRVERNAPGKYAVAYVCKEPVNAMDAELWEELQQVLDEMEADKGVRALVFAPQILIDPKERKSAGLPPMPFDAALHTAKSACRGERLPSAVDALLGQRSTRCCDIEGACAQTNNYTIMGTLC